MRPHFFVSIQHSCRAGRQTDHAMGMSSDVVAQIIYLLVHLHCDRRRQLSALAAGVLALSISIGGIR